MYSTALTYRAAPMAPRRNLHGQLQLLILPGIIAAFVAILTMHGCAASGDKPAAAAGRCSSEEKAHCICKEPSVISFTVEDMACPNCAKELQAVIAAVKGVKAAKVCFEDKKAFVTLDRDHPATMEAIQAAVAKRQEEHSKMESDPNCIKPKG